MLYNLNNFIKKSSVFFAPPCTFKSNIDFRGRKPYNSLCLAGLRLITRF